MPDAQVPTSTKVALSVVVPATLVFALPLFTLWFADHTVSKWDAAALEAFEASISEATDVPEEQRAEQLAFVRAHPVSAVCTGSDAETAAMRGALSDHCPRFVRFHWATRTAQAAIGLGLLGALLMAISTLAAFSRRSLQLVSLKLGWNGLQIIAALETLLQGALLVWLSFWITAEWFGIYFPKLIVLAIAFAGLAAFTVIKAIFSRPDESFHVEAELLLEADAPEFWKHLRRLAAQLDTAPPDNVLVGIDTNFFVTESDVTVGETVVSGRTLFVSLSLLRQLEQSEADAVLIHELGHLLGGDTGHSKQLAPYLMRFTRYLDALAENPLCWPVFGLMWGYATLFLLARSRSERIAELAADALAVQWTSAQHFARSLVKFSAFHTFRVQTEDALFGEDQHQKNPDLAARLAAGYAEFARSRTLKESLGDMDGEGIPHPFDSHPPISARLAAAGANLTLDEVPTMLQREVRTTWLSRIPVAEAIEGRLWSAYNERLSAFHEMALAYRYAPASDAEREHVERFFPPLSFAPKPGKSDAVEGDSAETGIDCFGVTSPDLEGVLSFSDVESAQVNERLLKRYLDVKLRPGLDKKKQSVCLSRLAEPDAFVSQFERYLQRHKASVEHHASVAAEAEAAQLAAG